MAGQLPLECLQPEAHPVVVPGHLRVFIHLDFFHQIGQDTQVVEGVDLAGDGLRQRTYMGTVHGALGQQGWCGTGLFEVFDDGHGLGQNVTAYLQHWNQPIGRQGGMLGQQLLAPHQVHGDVIRLQPLELQRNTHPVGRGRAKVAVEFHACSIPKRAVVFVCPARTLFAFLFFFD